jgi:Tfp pilus assembly protein PilV
MRSQRCARPTQQRGVIMIFTLIALVLLLIGAAALLRTVDTSSILVGNLAFRRDLTNRSESAIMTARTALVSGALSTEAARIADLTTAGAHYYASKQANSGTTGVPALLLNTSAYDTLYAPTASSDGIMLRWMIDRQCTAVGAFVSEGCQYTKNTSADPGGAPPSPGGPPVAGTTRPVYRITVRVTGPRNTEAFYQTTYAD